MPTTTIEARSVVAEPDAYITEDRFRSLSGFSNQVDLPSDTLKRLILEATEQCKRDAFRKQREELVTKDDEDRYFPKFKFFAHKLGRKNDATLVTAEDLTVYEAETTTTIATQFYAATSQRRVLHNISHAIDEVDAFNNYFTLQSGYPTNNRQVVLTYNYCGKPLEELIGTDKPLETACFEQAMMKVLKWYRDKRLRKGTTTLTLGGQTIAKDEASFKDLLKDHYDAYHEIIKYIKPFSGKIFTIGRGALNYRNRRGYGGYGVQYN